MKVRAALVTLLLVVLISPTHAAIASVYGGSDGYCGRPVAAGGVLDCRALTAAHRTLRFGTLVRVTLAGRSVVVKINDRGPFVRGREIDLSPAAAARIGCAGLCSVTLEVLSGPPWSPVSNELFRGAQ